MKVIINLAILISVILAVLLTLPVKDGNPFLSIGELKALLTGQKSLTTQGLDLQLGSGSETSGNAYRWKDSEGNWHFSDRSEDSTAEKITLRQAQTVKAEEAASSDTIKMDEEIESEKMK